MTKKRKQAMEGKAGVVDASWVCHAVYCNDKRVSVIKY